MEPFERVGHHCAWSGATAMVWFWDEAVVQADPECLGLPPGDTHRADAPAGISTLPETVLYPKRADGIHVQACREGFDLQCWRDGVLVDSLWLAERPDADRVRAFAAQHAGMDEAGLAGGVDGPAVSAAAFAPDPWASPFQLRAWLLANERALVVAALALFAAVAAYQEARFWRYHFADASYTAEFDRIERELDPVLEARNELDALNQRNAFLARVLNQPSQAELMLHVDRALPREATEFHAWRYERGGLTVVLSDDVKRDPVAVIESLQADPVFADVRPGRSGQEGMEVTLRIEEEASRP